MRKQIATIVSGGVTKPFLYTLFPKKLSNLMPKKMSRISPQMPTIPYPWFTIIANLTELNRNLDNLMHLSPKLS